MSGVGKSTSVIGLARRGFTTVDTDDGPWIEHVDGEPLWRAELIDELLEKNRTAALFVAGNPFGKAESERRQIARDIDEVEPLLHRAATHEIVTVCPPEEVVDRLAAIAHAGRVSGARAPRQA